MYRKKSQLSSVQEILKQSLRTLKIDEKIINYQIWTDWEKIVGKTLAQKAIPKSIKSNHTLILEVETSAWMNEILLLKPMLLQKIKQFCPSSKINEIKLWSKST